MTPLAKRLTADRLARLMTWEAYAKFLGVSASRVHAIVAGAPASSLTKARIAAKLAEPVSSPMRSAR